MRPPTWPLRGDGRCVAGNQPTSAAGTGAGVVGAAREEGSLGNVGDPGWDAGSRLATARPVPVPPGVGEAHGTEETGESPAEGRSLTPGMLGYQCVCKWRSTRRGLATAHRYVYDPVMKRREVERQLRALGWKFLRHGGKHDVWTDGSREDAVPRHAEINEKLASAILNRARKKV
jgi:mRNA interferase HicA